MESIARATSPLPVRIAASTVQRAQGHNSAAPPRQVAVPGARYGQGQFLNSSASIVPEQLVLATVRHPRQCRRSFIQAAVATDAPPVKGVEQAKRFFNLGGQSELQVRVLKEPDTTLCFIELSFEGSLANEPILLHWGVTRRGGSGWVLPGESERPFNTRNYKNRALQTNFNKTGNKAVLVIEVDSAKVEAVEFLVKNEKNNEWFKMEDGSNFRAEVSRFSSKSTKQADGASHQTDSPADIPEELVAVQSYLRWERAGKPNYSPDQQHSEYEMARKELQDQVQSGVTINDLWKRLKGEEPQAGNGAPKTPLQESGGPEIPEELVGVQAYLRWERNGKRNYNAEEQQREYEEARKELQDLVRSGSSIEDLKKKLLGGKKEQAKTTTKPGRIQRKQWNPSDLINNYVKGQAKSQEKAAPVKEATPSAVEMGAQIIEGAANAVVISKKTFKLGAKQVLVLAMDDADEVRLRVASDYESPLVMHWGVSKDKKEWKKPPKEVVPEGSEDKGSTYETPFAKGFAGDQSLQSLEIVFGKSAGDLVGVPFVLRSGDNWIKNNGSDFFAALKAPSAPTFKGSGDASGTCKWLLDEIADAEPDAERSLMHRYNMAAGLLGKARGEGELGLAGVFTWLRYMATRQLNWNVNYNVKPREISAAQDKVTDMLEDLYQSMPDHRELTRLMLGAIGRGGEGDVGQRIRDEILVVQQNNNAKGGMLEEWHQKLHNNTSPDDVVICQALIDYLESNFNMAAYWDRLNKEGIDKARLLSYERAIHNEPDFKPQQKDGLIRDLKNYLKTLKAVHSGADLESAIAAVTGYSLEAMKGGQHGDIHVHPVQGISGALPGLLQFVLEHVNDEEPVQLMEACVESRRELRPSIMAGGDRLKDLLYLDIALDNTLRTAVERSLGKFSSWGAADLMSVVSLVVENLCMSVDANEELVYCLKDWQAAQQSARSSEEQWALRAKAVMDRTRMGLGDLSERLTKLLQPTAEYLGQKLGVQAWAVEIFTEEVIRMGSAASLSQLLNRLDPVLRAAADLGSWQVISPEAKKGLVEVVHGLEEVQDKVFAQPTVLVAERVTGEEEIPDGVVGVLTMSMPDVLSHVSVRARNSKVCFATCFDQKVFAELQGMQGKGIRLEPSSQDVKFAEIKPQEALADSDDEDEDGPPAGAPAPQIRIKQKKFAGRYAVGADDFTPELVGAKSRNLADLRGRLPEWIKLPTSVALPFGTFDQVIANPINKEVAKEVKVLVDEANSGKHDKLKQIRETVLKLKAPSELVEELKTVMKASNMPFPGDEGEERWEQAWTAIKKVWASKWNERAFFSCRKAKINHNDLSMAVLVQQVINADYAYVIHTTNPSSGDQSEIYAEVVKGLGETLVGAYPGRALSFVAKKDDLDHPKVLGFPSKRVGLFTPVTLIFRSDSNGEDLEGYAGAGLYDSVTMDADEEKPVDYSVDVLLCDKDFQRTALAKIAAAGAAVEKALGSPQDIEGCIKDGELYMVQTRPQM